MRIWSRLREVLLSSEVCRTSPKKTNWRRCNSFLEHLQGIDVNFFGQIFLDLCDGLRHSEGNALSLHDESQETLTGSSILILYSDHWGEYLPTETEFVPVNVFFPSPLLNRCASFFPFKEYLAALRLWRMWKLLLWHRFVFDILFSEYSSTAVAGRFADVSGRTPNVL